MSLPRLAGFAAIALLQAPLAARADPPAALAGIQSPAQVESFWQRQQSRLPLMEPLPDKPGWMRVTFLWRESQGRPVALSAGFLLQEGLDVKPMESVPGTDIRFLVRDLPADARGSYYYVLPGSDKPRPEAVWHDVSKDGPRDFLADPQAQRTYEERGEDGQIRKVSWLAGPGTQGGESWWVDAPQGRWSDHLLQSKALGMARPFSVYVPRGVDAVRRADGARGTDRTGAAPGLLLMFDRDLYRIAGRLPSMLDALIGAGKIRPLIAVLVSSVDDEHRGRDLPPNAPFQSFLADELVPYVRAHYRVSHRARDAIVAGSSYGGLAAMYSGLAHPELFGNVISQSGSFWWYPACCDDSAANQNKPEPAIDAGPDADMGWLIERYALQPKAALRIDMNVGRWEGSLMLIPNRMMHHVLRARGYPVHYSEYTGGHDIVQWRATLPGALERLFGGSASRGREYHQ